MPEKSSSQAMSSVALPFFTWSVDFGLVKTRTSGTGWKYVPCSPTGLRPAFLNSPAMIVRGQFFAAGAGAAAFETVAGQVGDVGLDPFGGNGGGRVGRNQRCGEKKGAEARQ